MVDSGVCFDIFTAYPMKNYLDGVNGHVGAGGIVLGIVYFLNAMLTLYWIHQQQRNAQRGMEGAAKHVIFPIYLPFLWMSAITDSIVGAVIFFYDINYSGENSWTAAGAAAAIFSMQHLVIEGTAFILMQYGCGISAAKNAGLWALGWAVTTFIVQFISYRDGDTRVSFAVNLTWNVVLLVFYFCLWYLPEKWIFRRPSVIFYSRYWVTLRAIVLISLILVHIGGTGTLMELVGNCFNVAGALLMFMCLKPYIVYKALLMDSKWWQGVARSGYSEKMSKGAKKTFSKVLNNALLSTGLRKSNSSTALMGKSPYQTVLQHDPETGLSRGHGQSSPSKHGGASASSSSSPNKYKGNKYEQLKDPLDGVEVGFSDAQELAREVDYISTSSVKLLNFAFISLDNKAVLLGAGSFSKVYAGRYKSHPVAIKMLFTQDLNPDVVKRCGNEARILTDISPHPNVVHIYGVAVLPPSVCLILEICEFGSLSDVLRGVNAGGVTRAALSLSYADRMFLARGCARGLQALHNYSPDLCHRDIKSMNFLIDSQLNAKICDLELGGIRDEHHRLSSDVRPTSDSTSKGQGQRVNTFATNMNITWQAPEIILGQEYTQQSDIYSLALVLWEIVATGRNTRYSSNRRGRSGSNSSGRDSPVRISSSNHYGAIPYSECKSQHEIREKVVQGYRPHIPAAAKDVSRSSITSRDSESSVSSNCSATAGELDPIYVDLLTMGWHSDPGQRPDIDYIVKRLNRCWSNAVHRSIYDTEYIIDVEVIQEENLKLTLLRDFKAASGGSGSNSFNSSSIISRNGGGILLGHTLSRAPPSPAVMATLNIMQSEASWSLLEDDSAAYLVVTAVAPYFILWATKKFTQLTGFLVNDVIAYDLDILFGPLSNHMGMNNLLSSVLYGNTEHLLTSIYRRDGKAVTASVHMFPIFDATKSDFMDSGYMSVDSSPASSGAVYRPGRLSFSARDDPDAGTAQRGNANDIKALLQANTMIDKKKKIDTNIYRTALAAHHLPTPALMTPASRGSFSQNTVVNTIQAVVSPTASNTLLNSSTGNFSAAAYNNSNYDANNNETNDNTSNTERNSSIGGSSSGLADNGNVSNIPFSSSLASDSSSITDAAILAANTASNTTNITASNSAQKPPVNPASQATSGGGGRLMDWASHSIANMSPFRSGGATAADHTGPPSSNLKETLNPIQTNKAVLQAHYRRVAYIAIQFNAITDKL